MGVGDVIGLLHVVLCCVHVGRACSLRACKPDQALATDIKQLQQLICLFQGEDHRRRVFLLPLFLCLLDVKRQAQIAGELVSTKCHPRPTQFYSASLRISGDGF